MFGFSFTPEMYHQIMQQLLQGYEGVHNIINDIIKHASSQVEQDVWKCCWSNAWESLYP